MDLRFGGDEMSEVFSPGDDPNKEFWTFRKLQFNDTISIRMKHTSYAYSFFFRSQCVINFTFLDSRNVEVVRFTIIPGRAEFQLTCPPNKDTVTYFSDNAYKKSYRFVLLFSSVGIMLFHDEYLNSKTDQCINRITDITKFRQSVIEAKGFESTVEIRSETSRIPSSWHIIEPIPMGHGIAIEYFRHGKSIITIRLGDKNGITALALILDYTKGVLYTKRDRLDDENVVCVNFGSSVQFISTMLGRIEIIILPYHYKIDMLTADRSKTSNSRGCLVSGHHLSPYDIGQTILDSTSKNTVFYYYYVYEP
ncbi:hypothetical protein LOAG_13447 [Loa loa]|uniref:IgGFc_binding domain-containing protein n=1 Tax=Loa loa TaxID=7209 RepID=A0A1I7W4H0_LOALO|nr:hypothetical protein LOAG_13447 [Loa loa]EFO15068.2 hypothetical protein LOAG_13447 [Loa loa]